MPSQQELMAAYAATRFEAEVPDGLITLRIGQRSDALRRLYQVAGTQSAAYITACNPASIPQTEDRNRSAHAELLRSLNAGGYRHYEGFGRDPTGQWPAERSVLVMGISEEEACALGRQHGQAAVVVAVADTVPHLRWLM